jgi:hypothetical protein
MGQGQDLSVMFVREQYSYFLKREFEVPPVLEGLKNALLEKLPRTRMLHRVSPQLPYCDIDAGLVLLAGVLYPYARVSVRTRQQGELISRRFFYDEVALRTFFHDHGYALEFPKPSRWSLNAHKQRWDSFFSLRGDDRLLRATVELQLPLLQLVQEVDYPVLEICPSLKALEFFRCLNPWQVFQELSMFVGNLATPEPPMVAISEKEKVAKHGFDEWSFRKMPKKG